MMATKFSIKTVFSAVDKVSGPLEKMTGRIAKSTRKVERSLRNVNKPLLGITRGLKTASFAAGAFAAAAGTATVVALNKAADTADALAKQSRRLNFPIEALQEWGFVAEQSGLSVASLNNSLDIFAKRIGEAKTGQGALSTGLSKLNPTLLGQINRAENLSDAFELYIEAMRASTSATEQAALANAAFGRSALDIVNISKNSADAVSALRKEQRENGIITMGAAEAAEAYNDAFNSLKRSIVGVTQITVLSLAPILAKVARSIRSWVVANKDLIKSKFADFVSRGTKAITQLVKKIEDAGGVKRIIDSLGDSLEMVAKGLVFIGKHGKTIAMAVGGVVALTTALQIFTGVMTAVNIVLLANPIGLIVAGIAALIAAVAAAIIWWDELKEKILGLPTSVKVAFAVLMGPIGWLVGAASLIVKNWEPIKTFFKNLWDGVASIFDAGIKKVADRLAKLRDIVTAPARLVKSLGGKALDLVGFGGDEETKQGAGQSEVQRPPQVASPQAGIMRMLSEQNSRAEVVLKNETSSTAEVTSMAGPMDLKIANSGAF